jgi:hypothetical protein
MQIASLILACIGIIATGGVAWYVHQRTNTMTIEMKNFLLMLIINSAPDPKVLQRLKQDVEKTGEWWGEIEKDPNNPSNYRIAWKVTPAVAKIGLKAFAPTVKITKRKSA